MNKAYTHRLGEEVRSIAGWYCLEEEGTFAVGSEEVLYVVGNAVVDSSCCGVGGCRYAIVPGFLRAYKTHQDDQGLWVSEVAPVKDADMRRRITKYVKEKEAVMQVEFS